jgi:hypothetical protein
MERKQGIIRVVAKNGGIKFEGEDMWYNPTDAIQEKVTLDWRGKGAELELISPNTFTSIREVAILDRDQIITRQVAIKAAAELAKANIVKSEEELFSLADKIEKWVQR